MSDRQDRFEYSYSAPTEEERREIQYIMKSYQPKEKTRGKLEELRALDAKVKRLPLVLALTLGIAGCLIFGGGMAMALELGMPGWGTAASLAGVAVMATAYPTHKTLLAKNKSKYRDEILALSAGLLGDGQIHDD